MHAPETFMSRFTAVVTLSLLAAASSQADVYRFVDSKGQVQYTDRPETLPAELLAKIRSQRTDNSALADKVAADLQARDTSAKAQQVADQAKADKAAAAQITATDKANRCAQARGRYESVSTTDRVYSLDAKGERVYMDDQQLDKSRATAKQQMDTWCN
jgi:Domain of unknown function (DUF4124)